MTLLEEFSRWWALGGWEVMLWWCVVVVGLAGTALLSGMETGAYCLNRVRLEVRAARGPRRRGARVLSGELAQPERMLAANLVANLICGDLAATGVSSLLVRAGYGDIAVIVITALVLTPVFFVMVESVPKELFRLESDRLTYVFAPVLPVIRWGLTVIPVLPLVRVLTAGIVRLLGRGSESALEESARERVANLLKESVGTGALSESQASLVDRAMVFQRGAVGDHMQRLDDMPTLGLDGTLGRFRQAVEQGAVWVPVIEASPRGRVIGVVWHAEAYLRPEMPIRALLLEPARLTARTPLPEAVAALRAAPAPVGIVEEGERGIGLVVMDDLIEPLLRSDER